MKRYSYKIFREDGTAETGVITADTAQEAAARLHEQGCTIAHLQELPRRSGGRPCLDGRCLFSAGNGPLCWRPACPLRNRWRSSLPTETAPSGKRSRRFPGRSLPVRCSAMLSAEAAPFRPFFSP